MVGNSKADNIAAVNMITEVTLAAVTEYFGRHEAVWSVEGPHFYRIVLSSLLLLCC
jgi:hypothetical protein